MKKNIIKKMFFPDKKNKEEQKKLEYQEASLQMQPKIIQKTVLPGEVILREGSVIKQIDWSMN